MSSPEKIMEKLAREELRALDLGSYENLWEHFLYTGEHAGCESLGEFLAKLADMTDRLGGVEVVNLNENRLQEVPDFVTRLPRLSELNLYRNQLTDLPARLADVRRLKVLRLRENRFRRVPDIVFELLNLEELDFGNNPVDELPKGLSALQHLRILRLVNTEIRNIPAALVDLPELVDLDCRNVPLARLADLDVATIPRSVVAQGLNAWRSYRAELRSGASSPDEVKLVLVGNGQVGKTTLRQNLLYPDVLTSLPRDGTKGLEVCHSMTLQRVDPAVAGRVRINLWDFGGQGKYRQVQQLFCTPEAIYVYVRTPDSVEAADEDHYVGDDYWLSMISAFQEDGQPRAPRSVFYVVSKTDQSADEVLIDQIGLNKRFPAVREFHAVSFLTGRGVEDLRRALASQLDSAEKVSPKWIAVRDHLRAECHKPFITRREFYDLCDEHGIQELESKRALLGYLNNRGVLLQFDKGLKHRILLDPDWVRAAVYAVFDYAPAVRDGWFTDEDLERIWPSYAEEDHDQLLDLMKAFELCYTVREDGEIRHMVPALFSEPQPGYRFDAELGSGTPVRRVICRFTPFLPAGLIARLTVRFGKDAHYETERRWRTCLVLRLGESLVELREDWREGVLNVTWSGAEWATQYRWVIRRELENLCRTLAEEKGIANLELRDSIPCPCSLCRTLEEEDAHQFPVGLLLERSARGTISCKRSGRAVAVAELFEETGTSRSTTRPRVFISYNRHDRGLAEDLAHRLDQRGAEPSLDVLSPLGDRVTDFIQREIEAADAVVLLVSRYSMESIWVWKELKISSGLNKRLITCVVDENYYDDDFQSQMIDFLDRRVEELRAELNRLIDRRSPTDTVHASLKRHLEARSDLDLVLKKVDGLARLDPLYSRRGGGSPEEYAEAIVRSIHQSGNGG